MNNKFELFMGCLGNGITICNKAVMKHGDYKHIAHIGNNGTIKWYVDWETVPLEYRQKIGEASELQKKKFLEWYNIKDNINKYCYLYDLCNWNETSEYTKMICNKNIEDIQDKIKILEDMVLWKHR